MMNYLLIISCSQRKVQSDVPLAPLELYDGPVYRSLRKTVREKRIPENLNLEMLIISAEHGLLGCKLINVYDRKMTLERAMELQAEIQRELRAFLRSKSWEFDEVFINLGKTYRQTLEGFHWGLTRTLEASGGIGQKTSQMKAWIERLYQEEMSACETNHPV